MEMMRIELLTTLHEQGAAFSQDFVSRSPPKSLSSS